MRARSMLFAGQRRRPTHFPVIHAFIQAAPSLNPNVRAFDRLEDIFPFYFALANASSHANISYACEIAGEPVRIYRQHTAFETQPCPCAMQAGSSQQLIKI
jgi:hypothetical protein